ncbi:MAG: flippase-like domain-containing protein [Anaerolineae bacterium]|nr:flippase-like domain-containing protein [Anaerolineae bacterium]
MRNWKLWLGLLVSAFFMWLALRGLKLGDVWGYMHSARLGWLAPGIVVYFLAVWARTWRWDYMLRPLKHVPLIRLFPVVVIGYMGNNVYPARAGEVLRSFVLREREAIPMSASLATVVVERVFDGLVMLIFVFVALPFTPLPSGSDFIRTLVNLASVAFFLALLVFFVLAAFPDRFYKMAEMISYRIFPHRIHHPLLTFLQRFLDGLESLRSFRSVLMIFFTSIIIWLLETVKYWFVMQAFDFQVSFFALMLMNGVVNLMTTFPAAPGYVGTFDAPGIAVLQLYGVPKEIATAYTLVLHAALWLPITLLGAYYMIRAGMRWSTFGKAVEVQEKEATVN